jgi:hypothetical protein
MTEDEKKTQIDALNKAATEQREYERKRSILMDEAVLVVTMLRQRIVTGPGIAPITGDGILLAAATLYAGWVAAKADV